MSAQPAQPTAANPTKPPAQSAQPTQPTADKATDADADLAAVVAEVQACIEEQDLVDQVDALANDAAFIAALEDAVDSSLDDLLASDVAAMLLLNDMIWPYAEPVYHPTVAERLSALPGTFKGQYDKALATLGGMHAKLAAHGEQAKAAAAYVAEKNKAAAVKAKELVASQTAKGQADAKRAKAFVDEHEKKMGQRMDAIAAKNQEVAAKVRAAAAQVGKGQGGATVAGPQESAAQKGAEQVVAAGKVAPGM